MTASEGTAHFPAQRELSPAGPPGVAGEFHIPSLDGIRAVSFMLVFVAHAGLGDLVPGAFGVTIFFFLSGYLITTLLRLERARTSRNSLRDFYLRRAFRILPPFYLVLTLAIVMTAFDILPGKLRAGSVLSQFAHFANYWFIEHGGKGFPAGTVVYWSLAVEEHFYAVFPWLFVFLQRWLPGRQRQQALILLGLCGLTLAWRAILAFGIGVPGERTSLGSDTRIDSILFGCVLAVFGNPVLDPWRGGKALWVKALLPLACALLAFSFTYRAVWFRETARYTLQGLALIPLFVVAIRYPDWGPMRLLNTRLARRVGLLSYSLYLSHQVVLIAIETCLPGFGQAFYGLLALALSLALATAILHFVERPSARLRKAWVATTWLKPSGVPPVEVAPTSSGAASATL
jgi:peptidoglycan/LPS O-acetylase OafA/YrhL